MSETKFEKSLVSDDYRTKEFEKFLLSKKYSVACELIGFASAYPTKENIEKSFGLVMDYVTFMPMSPRPKVIAKRDEILTDLNKISLVLHGFKKNKDVQTAIIELGLGTVRIRRGMQFVDEITELPRLLQKLQKIMITAGDYAVQCGLRLPVSEIKKQGMEKLKDEEGFADDEEDEEAAELKGKGRLK